MSTGFLWYDAQSKPLSTSGQVQAGCYLCFFLTGTSTPTNVYADGALTTPLSQPTPGSVNPSAGTVADINGRLPAIYLNPSVVYRYQLYSAAGVLLEDRDPFFAPGSPTVTFPNGTAAAPGIAFTNDSSTGLYLAGTHILGFATAGIAAGAIDASQGWSIPAATGENTFTIAGGAGHYAEVLNGSASTGQSLGLQINAGTNASDAALLVQNQALSAIFLELFGDGHGNIGPNATNALSWSTAGAFSIAAPGSGNVGLTVAGVAGSYAAQISSANSGTEKGLLINAGAASGDIALLVENQAASQAYLEVLGNGEAYIFPPAAATGVSGCFQIGYLDIPQNAQGVSYPTVMGDRGKHIYHNSASAHTYTINDATVNYPVGTAITFINEVGGGVVTIALQTTAANLIWTPSGGTGNRSLAAVGQATAIKVAAGAPGTWFISGTGLS